MVFGQMNEPPGARLRVGLTGADHGRVLPRREGRDVLLFIDNIFRFTQAGSEVSALLGRMPSRRGLPADAGHRDGRAAGAHHLDQEGLDHLAAGDLRARRRLHRPGAGHDLRPPRRDDHPGALDRRARHLPGGRSAGLDLAASSTRASSARSTTTSPARCSGCCSATGTCRTSSPSWASTSCRDEDKLTVARARAIERFMSQPLFVAEQFTGRPASTSQRAETVRGFKEILDGKHDAPARAGLLHGRARSRTSSRTRRR